MDVKKTFSEIKNANLWWLGLSILVSLFAFVSRAYRWNLLIEPLGYKPSLKNTTAALMVGYLANFAVPRLGEVSRCGALSTAEKVPFDKLLGTVIVERVIDVLSLLIIIIITVAVQFDQVKNFFFEKFVYGVKDKAYSIMHAVWFMPVAIGGLVIVTIVVIYFMRSKATSTLMVKIRALLKGIVEGVKSVQNLRSVPLFLFHTIFIWTMYFFMAYFGFFALNATSGLGWQAGLMSLVAGGMGMSAPVQGGIGAYHYMVSQALYIYKIAINDGLAYAIMMHGSQFLVVILFGAVGYVVLWFGNKKRENADA